MSQWSTITRIIITLFILPAILVMTQAPFSRLIIPSNGDVLVIPSSTHYSTPSAHPEFNSSEASSSLITPVISYPIVTATSPDLPTPDSRAISPGENPPLPSQAGVSTSNSQFINDQEASIPESYQITGFRGWHQRLSLDCEASAAAQWAAFFRKPIDERSFQRALPVSDNPDFGFVGNVNDPWGLTPPYGYGVYAGPVAMLLNANGIQAHAYKGFTLEQLKTTLAEGIPVIAWVVGNVGPGKAVPHLDSAGRMYYVAAFEHVVVVTGYTPNTIHYSTEGVNYVRSTEAFLNSWAVLDNMVVVK